MEAAIIVAVLVIGFLYASISGRNIRKRGMQNRIRNKYGLEPEIREPIKELIRNYHEAVSETECVDSVTWNDLNMDDVYQRINNCDSSVGEEMLYEMLHDTNRDAKQETILEQRINLFDAHEEKRQKVETILSDQGKDKLSYYTPSYMLSLKDFGVKNIIFYRVLQILLILAAATAIILHNYIGIMILVLVFMGNIGVYVVTVKFRYDEKIQMLGTIVYLLTNAKKLKKELAGTEMGDKLSESLACFGRIDKKTFLLQMQAGRSYGDAFETLQDFLLGATMWHIITFDKVMKMLEHHVAEYMQLYRMVGQIDAAISIGSFRRSLTYYAIPEYTQDKVVSMEDIYHPLIAHPVQNSAVLDKNCIITGSNASGKSTFIKTIAINVILAQTIHTCSAKSFLLPESTMITSMAVRDDIISGDSYFIKEIKYLKRILDAVTAERTVICVVDEILRGTNTQERIAASKAILEYLNGKNCIAMVASHDKELTELSYLDYDNYHFSEKIGEADVVFDYKLQKGPATSQNAIRLLEITGFPQSVINRANQIIAENA